METPNVEAAKAPSETPATPETQALPGPNVAAAPAAPASDALLQLFAQQNENLQRQIDELRSAQANKAVKPAKAEPQTVRVRQYRRVVVMGEPRKLEEIEQTYTVEDFERMSAKDERDMSQFDHLGLIVEVIEG